MNNTCGVIRRTLKETDFIRRAFPALTQWGVKDEDVMVHSLGVSLWNTLGHELGYQAVAECPAPLGLGDDIRSDSTWFDKTSRTPQVFIEFERYDGSVKSKEKLLVKLANLMEAAHRWEQPSALLILVAWSQGVVSAPDTHPLINKVRQGFKNSKGVSVAGTNPQNVLFCRFLLNAEVDGHLHLQDLRFQEGTES